VESVSIPTRTDRLTTSHSTNLSRATVNEPLPDSRAADKLLFSEILVVPQARYCRGSCIDLTLLDTLNAHVLPRRPRSSHPLFAESNFTKETDFRPRFERRGGELESV
jgi:hypothetical protein